MIYTFVQSIIYACIMSINISFYWLNFYTCSNPSSIPTGATNEENTNMPDIVSVPVLSAVVGILAVLFAVVMIILAILAIILC